MSGTHLPMERFDANARRALADAPLRAALGRAMATIGDRRRAAVEDAGGDAAWETLRERARALKDATLAHLDEHLARFAERAAAAGQHVHWARDAAEARAIVVGIARSIGAATVVKSKSMTTEEVRLGEALESAGIESVETDLGEWIVQLAREVPSHIITPAIHKTRTQIAELLAREIGTPRLASAEELTRAARRMLRTTFARADLGVSGVNFGVAETGTIVIVENEGNARLVTSLPRVHVALMGIEKVVPRLVDLEVFLELLPRSGTGQRATSYVSLLTGPRPDPGAEGPEELHLVLLDNGRSAMLERVVTRQALACIRCGACLNVCPVYQSVGGHAYGSVYPGPIGAVVTPQLAGLTRGRQLPFASSLCGACRDVCPVKIDIPELLLHLRSTIVEQRAGVPRGKRAGFALWSWIVRSPRRFRRASALLRAAQRPFVREGRWSRLGSRLVRHLPVVARFARGRELPPLAERSFAQWWDAEQRR